MRDINFIDPMVNIKRYAPNNLGLGYLFADTFKDRLLYVKDAKIWYFFDGCVWARDTGGLYTSRCAKALASYLKNMGLKLSVHADLLANMKHRETMVKDARDVNILTLNQFGANPHLINLLFQNFFEYRSQFTIFINTNHLPIIDDDSLFAGGRLKLIPFDRHFNDNEQDRGLKKLFREDGSRSAILNWLLEGYRRYKAEGLTPPKKAESLLHEYRKDSDVVGLYIESCLVSCNEKERSKTSEFYADFLKWCKNEGVAVLSQKEFVQILRQKSLLGRDRVKGHYIKGYRIKAELIHPPPIAYQKQKTAQSSSAKAGGFGLAAGNKNVFIR